MNIVPYPHPALRHPVKPLAAIDKQVSLQVGQMLELMHEANGLGLAANQVVLPYQVFVISQAANPEVLQHDLVCINPVILERKGSVEGEEGCLSFPGLYQKVRRARMVRVQAYNLEGKVFEITASELPARVLQHEYDHLQGVLYIDKMGMLAKMSARGAVKTLERDFRRAQERGEFPSDAQLLADLENGVSPHLDTPPPSAAAM